MPWVLILFFIASCSGYRYSQQDNPLSQYGIESLSVPMFHNYSNQPEVSNNFTRETYRLLSTYPSLRLKSGYHKETDAVLIGIIKSPEQLFQTITPSSYRAAEVVAGNALGSKREKFSIPGISVMNLSLQVIVIKNPTEGELALLKSGLGDKVKLSSRIIFNETVPLSSQFTREVFDNEEVSVTATQNAGLQRKVIHSLSEQAALYIRDMILYAF